MPSIVWDYFDEFEGGGKCRLCGWNNNSTIMSDIAKWSPSMAQIIHGVRNRKDKSTSTFWQHLERVHGLDKRHMLTINGVSSPNNLKSGGKSTTGSCGSNAKKHARDVTSTDTNEIEPVEKIPKLELMGDLDQRATEETFKFISELVKQQQLQNTTGTGTNSSHVASIPIATSNKIYHQERDSFKNVVGISPIGINLQSLDRSIANSSISPSFDKMPNLPHIEPRPPSLNDYINGLLLLDNASMSMRSRLNSTSPPSADSSIAKAKTPTITESQTSKRNDYLSWDEFFMGAALLTAQRSKDPSTQVGACIVKDNIIVGMGYNGMPIGCNDDEMPWGKRNTDTDVLNTKHPYVCHAELNAIVNKNCADIRDSTLYTTLFPCCECAKLIIQSRITRVVYLKEKQSPETNASRRLFDITSTKYSKFQPTRNEVTIQFK